MVFTAVPAPAMRASKRFTNQNRKRHEKDTRAKSDFIEAWSGATDDSGRKGARDEHSTR